MTAKKTLACLSHPSKNPITPYGITCVFRAAGRETAGWPQPWRDQRFVGHERQEREFLTNASDHAGTPRRDNSSIFKSENFRSQAERRGLTTMSNPPGTNGHAVRKISLTRRRIRFLLTAIPSFRGVVSP